MRAFLERWSPRRKVLVVGLVAALAVAVPVAWASHDFTDVPDASPFHGDISAVKGAGITAGKTCVPPGTLPTYCPTESITREAMAAFVHRGFGRVGFSESVVTVPSDGILVAVVPIAVGGTAGGTQFVRLDAVLSTAIDSMSGCPCQTAWFIVWLEGDDNSFAGFTANTFVGASGVGFDGASAATVFAVPSGTTQTFGLVALPQDGTGIVGAHGVLTAMTVPFGSTGANILRSKLDSVKVPAGSPYAKVPTGPPPAK